METQSTRELQSQLQGTAKTVNSLIFYLQKLINEGKKTVTMHELTEKVKNTMDTFNVQSLLHGVSPKSKSYSEEQTEAMQKYTEECKQIFNNHKEGEMINIGLIKKKILEFVKNGADPSAALGFAYIFDQSLECDARLTKDLLDNDADINRAPDAPVLSYNIVSSALNNIHKGREIFKTFVEKGADLGLLLYNFLNPVVNNARAGG